MSEPLRRVFDVVVAAVVLLLSAPVLLAAAVAIAVESRGGVMFRQSRVGRDGREFDVLKLRTMVDGAEQLGAGLAVDEGDARITRVGAFLRRTSIDEIPNLINVLRGEMSIIGPRPTVPSQVEQYTPRQRGRLAARPGITGWAQVHGRASLPWSERIELDLWYIENRSLRIDLQILARTALLIIGGDGLYRGSTGGWSPGDGGGGARSDEERDAARVFMRRRLVAGGVLVALIGMLGVGVARIGGGEEDAPKAKPVRAFSFPAVEAPRWLIEDAAVGEASERLAALRMGGTRRREIALTFDDGPTEFTPEIIRILRRYNAGGTFFQVGTMIDRNPGQTNAMASMPGVEIGNHSIAHPRMDLLGKDEQAEQITGANRLLTELGVRRPMLFRPPYGATNEDTIRLSKKNGMLPVLWSIDSVDYTRPGAKAIADLVVSQAKPGSIVLMHDGVTQREQTVAALPRILSRLKKQGYRFVTVSQLLVDNPPPLEGNSPSAGPAYTATD